MLRRKLIISILGAIALCFCISESKAQSLLSNGEIPKDLIITLERTMCDGACPAYKMTVESDGKVNFEGYYRTEIEGKAEGKITQEQLKKIIAEFEKINFFGFRDNYKITDAGCGSTDMPSEIIFIKINGKSKKIYHYFGCEGDIVKEVRLLTFLGKKIDEITNSARWIGEGK